MNYSQVYKEGTRRLKECEIREAELDARLLLEYVCKTDRNTLLAHPDREVSEEEENRFFALIGRREKREPLQYITGEQDFMGLPFKTGRDTLIPRQDTECLVEEALKELHDGMDILDLCCGTGCILLSLLWYSNDCKGTGADIDANAVALAKENHRILSEKKQVKSATDEMAGFGAGEGGQGLNAEFFVSDLFEQVEGRYDMIVSNPPYIPAGVIDGLDPEVKDYEPRRALDGGADGLDFYKILAKESKEYLKRGGVIFLEIGFDQGEAVKMLLEQEGYKNVEVLKDLAGLDRVVRAHFY